MEEGYDPDAPISGTTDHRPENLEEMTLPLTPEPDGVETSAWLLPSDADETLVRYKPKNCCENYCCGGLQGMACGWPKGTVRAIIAITLLVVVLGVEGFLVLWLVIKGNDTAAIGVGAGMLAELGSAFGFYFGSRSSSSPQDDATHHEEREEREARLRQARRRV